MKFPINMIKEEKGKIVASQLALSPIHKKSLEKLGFRDPKSIEIKVEPKKEAPKKSKKKLSK